MDKPWTRSTKVLVTVLYVALFALLLMAQANLENAQDQLRHQELLLDQLEQEIHESQDELDRLRQLAPFAQAIYRWNPDVNPWALAAQVVESSRRWAGDLWQQVAWDVVAMGGIESRWQTRAVGSRGERGPLQVLPSTARWLGVSDLSNWRQTLDAGVRYYARVALPAAGVDPLLTASVVARESRFRPGVRGAAGEVGLMQVLPVAAAAVGVSEAELTTVDGNLRAGIRYLAQQVRRYGVSRGLAAYNGGPNGWRIGRARRYAEQVGRGYDALRQPL